MGKFIAIDGVDASGKQTHTELLEKYFTEKGVKVRRLSFPMYNSESSALVKMYLGGQFGNNADDVDAYCASTFYAADRFATYKSDWHADYEDENTLIIADRYVSSNMIHQASKIDDTAEKDKFLDWLSDFEYGLYKIPQPDVTIFLDMPPEYGRKLMENRNNKITDEKALDIHESDANHLIKSYNNAKYVADKFSWNTVSCVKNGEIRSIEDIQDEVRKICESVIESL